MVLHMVMMKIYYWLCIILSVALSFTSIGIYVVPFLLIYMAILTVRMMPVNIAWFNGSYDKLLFQCIINIVFSILMYSILYFKSGLIVNGQYQSVDFATALYFSGTTWTTVGYGDISAPVELRLLTTIEALNGYLSMAILIALIGLWLNDSLASARNYTNLISSSSKKSKMKNSAEINSE
ncbi:ion channel [Psychromonas sp. GE-S-Ul-11]|uniref:ion channel n=2 Tax=Psychromonas sp. GE-S-Ul-11 TaxID=3241170 RepID=UPI00390CD6ED